MKLSMWILADWLKEHHVRHDIQDGTASISGVRFIGGELKDFPRDFVYVTYASEAFTDQDYADSIMLVHGYDFMFVENSDIETLVNEILAAIDYYNEWESRLWEVSTLNDGLQKMIDLSDGVLNQPSRIMSMDGRALAISNSFDPADIDKRWKYLCETGIVDIKNIQRTITTIEGEDVPEWQEAPRRYRSVIAGEDGGKMFYIAANIVVDGEIIASFVIQQFHEELTEAHCQLAGVFCEILRSSLRSRRDLGKNVMLRSRASIVLDLLEGEFPNEAYSLTLIPGEEKKPLQLAVIRSTLQTTHKLSKGGMLTGIREKGEPNISVEYGDVIVSIILEEKREAFVKSVHRVIDPLYHVFGFSLPFEGWGDIPLGYKQACFAVSMSNDVPGIYECEDYAFDHLVASIADINQALKLSHPALLALKTYDEHNSTEFYETLYHFIKNERSLTETSRSMYLHRNTLIYRIRRIHELIGSDLADPKERAFIYFSYQLAGMKD